MKEIYYIIILLFFLIKNGSAQDFEFEQVEYSKDSIPIIIKINTSTNGIKEDKNFLRNSLNLSLDDEFQIIKTSVDEFGILHNKYQHYFKGLCVEFSQYNIHSKDGNIQLMNGKVKKIRNINLRANLNQEEAYPPHCK